MFRGLLDRIHHRAEHAHFRRRDVLSRTVEIDNFRKEQRRARDRIQHAAVVELDPKVVRRISQRQMEIFVPLRSPERIQLQSKRAPQLRDDAMHARRNDDNRSTETAIKLAQCRVRGFCAGDRTSFHPFSRKIRGWAPRSFESTVASTSLDAN